MILLPDATIHDNNYHIVIFDGVCNFCNGAVNFIIARDPNARFIFAPMQSDYAKRLTHHYNIQNVGVDTFLLVKRGRCYIWTDAALEIAQDLSGGWPLCRVFKIIPRSLRDSLYRAFARNRYKLFGRSMYCRIPDEKLRSRFRGIIE